MDIPVPPDDGQYATAAAAIDFIQSHGKSNGYCMITRRSKPDGVDSHDKTAYYLQCDRYGSYQSRSAGIRQGSTKTIGCSFKIVVRRIHSLDDDVWTLDIQDAPHNHDRSANASAHPGHRRRDIAATDA